MLRPIPQGAAVGIVTPSSSLDSPEQIRSGLSYLAELGFQVKTGNFVYGGSCHFSGTPQERAADINGFFKNPEIAAIIATAGGYGAQDLLPYLDYEAIRKAPKPIIGFSDITTLQAAIYARTGVPSVAGIMLKYDFSSGTIQPKTKSSFENLLGGKFAPISAGNILNPGLAEGVLLGTNFCTLMSLAGTKYFPPLAGSILLLEDIDEKSYRIERMLTQLEQQSDFEQISGIIFGAFGNCTLNHPQDKDIEAVLDAFAARHPRIVMIKHFPFGHIKSRICLPLGIKMRLNAVNETPTLQTTD